MRAIVTDTGRLLHGLRRLRISYEGTARADSVVWLPEEFTAPLLEDHLNAALLPDPPEESDPFLGLLCDVFSLRAQTEGPCNARGI